MLKFVGLAVESFLAKITLTDRNLQINTHITQIKMVCDKQIRTFSLSNTIYYASVRAARISILLPVTDIR